MVIGYEETGIARERPENTPKGGQSGMKGKRGWGATSYEPQRNAGQNTTSVSVILAKRTNPDDQTKTQGRVDIKHNT